MKITSKEYDICNQRLDDLEIAFSHVIGHAELIQKELDAVKSEDEELLLLAHLGKIMDKHTKEMGEI